VCICLVHVFATRSSTLHNFTSSPRQSLRNLQGFSANLRLAMMQLKTKIILLNRLTLYTATKHVILPRQSHLPEQVLVWSDMYIYLFLSACCPADSFFSYLVTKVFNRLTINQKCTVFNVHILGSNLLN